MVTAITGFSILAFVIFLFIDSARRNNRRMKIRIEQLIKKDREAIQKKYAKKTTDDEEKQKRLAAYWKKEKERKENEGDLPF